jgi:hypothetical protein
MSRLYTVTDKQGKVVRYVRAHTLNAAVRAVAEELFSAKASTTDEIYLAMTKGAAVLDALAPEQADIDDVPETPQPLTLVDDPDDPGPVPQEAA